jgi:serine/threonine protein kinase
MGDVYKARDTHLDRIVAIKISKTEFSERFEREARAVAALNHSNICTLHDVGPIQSPNWQNCDGARSVRALNINLHISRRSISRYVEVDLI